MRTPIAYALAWPERIESGVAPLDLFQIAHLDFSAPDFTRFPCIGLAYQALRAGGSVPALLNAANEVAVAAFLERRITFLDIPRLIEAVLGSVARNEVHVLQDVLDADASARRAAQEWIAR
ncbi:MAG: 1-deoxy-D-xylulose-5-phosphate reductoisomerase, partial [Sideroxydans sp.]